MCQEVDHQLTVTEDQDRTLEGFLFPCKLGQALEGILKGKVLSFVIGEPSTIISSSPDDLHTVHIQNYEATVGIPFQGTAIELHI